MLKQEITDKSDNNTEKKFRKSSVMQIQGRIFRSYPKILSKLEKLPESGLGNPDESKQELIENHREIRKKIQKTARKLQGLALLYGITWNVAAVVGGEKFGAKKFRNLLRSADLYDNWMRDLNMQINAFNKKT